MDARSLLRAKKAAARIDHPYATYTASGILRCSICAVPVKQWDAHLLTKQHRTSVAREKASLGKAAAKRPAEEGLDGGAKRARLKDEEAEDDGEGDGGGRGGGGRGPSLLPAGFFSAGNRPAEVDEEGDEEDEAGPSTSTVARAPAAKTGDAELDDFFASLTDDTPIIDPIQPAQGAVPAAPRRAVPSRRAEITGVASYEAGPIRNIVEPQKGEDEPEPEPEPEESEAERQERVAREEREEIMGRLEEEERAQEDADSRVTALKQRMEMLKKRREAGTGKAKQKTKLNGA